MHYFYNGKTARYGILTATRTRNGKPTKIIKLLKYLKEYGPVSKYELVCEVLGKKGTRRELRGYYSTNFIKFRDSGLINLDWDTRTYSITQDGLDALDNYPIAV